jgi:2-phosphosulfolactate phosphatase
MRLDVFLTPLGLVPGDLAGRTVLVLDVLRATTTTCAAMHAGARAVAPVADPDDAIRLAQTLGPDTVLAGERGAVRIPGFHLGNSPLEMSPDAVGGRTVVMCTTNGTRALLAAEGARSALPAAAANLAAAGAAARAAWEADRDLAILCAGREGRFALEDAYAAGRFVLAALGGRRLRRGLNDAALMALDLVRRYGDRWERPLGLSAAGRDLAALGYGADVAAAADPDRWPVLLEFRDRRVRVAPPEERAA